jgi:NADPH-dependent glutamate synthase beta subunit-like oxidoreductase
VCEHPCETRCRRTLLDAPVNIRGLKRTAVDRAGIVPAPASCASTGKRVAIIGGGPSGLSAAYYLQLMGHQCTVFEKHKRLGGMLVYGIPAYRLPRERLQKDIDCILSTGVEVKLNTKVGEGEYTMERLREEYDAVYISIGAHTDKKAGIEGEDAKNVLSAVEFLGNIGDDEIPDFTGKKVCIIGGGNVAMDCTRSAIRCGAERVSIVYRRRKEDMTALVEEVDGAIAEGAVMMDLHAPLRIETDEEGKVAALWASPKMPGKIQNGRMNPTSSGLEDKRIPCDIVVVAVGQGIDFHTLESAGIPVVRGVIKAEDWTAVDNAPGVFAGGDCVTGPKTAIRAIAAGKVAAANIDNYLGFNHKIAVDVDIPTAALGDRDYCGRINMAEREPEQRKHDFELMELLMTEKESCQEAGRCLRCDHFGCGSFKGGRKTEW